MTAQIAPVDAAHAASGRETQFLTLKIGDHLFGLPLLAVQEVQSGQVPTPIRLAPNEVAGAINLRGRIITVIDVRTRLGLPPAPPDRKAVGVVVEHADETYELLFDAVGDVLSVGNDLFEDNPPTLDPAWRGYCSGLYRLESCLLIVLKLDTVLQIDPSAQAFN